MCVNKIHQLEKLVLTKVYVLYGDLTQIKSNLNMHHKKINNEMNQHNGSI